MNASAFFLLFTLLASVNIFAAPWQPANGNVQIPIWPGVAPDAISAEGPESADLDRVGVVAGKPWMYIENVVNPTMTVFSPKGHNTGVAVVVFPGGGYQVLAIDLEGTEVCDWLTTKGITCVLLKYRVPGSAHYWNAKLKRAVNPKVYTALQDAQRAISLVRSRASEWKIDPRKVGVLGFSAGGHLVALASTNSKRIYRAVDAADNESIRPDFAVAIYPGHLWDGKNFQLRTDTQVHVTKETSPTFLLHAQDDPTDDVNHSLVYYSALKKAKVPVEMHLYAEGGHAFGLRPTRFPITQWPSLVEAWLGSIGMVANGKTSTK